MIVLTKQQEFFREEQCGAYFTVPVLYAAVSLHNGIMDLFPVCRDIIYSLYFIDGNMATMHIDSYTFGHIVINNKTFSSDVIVYPDRVDPSWWRKEGHYLNKEDLSTIVTAKPDILIIGTGQFGVMEVPRNTVAFLESQGIKVYIEKTGLAVHVFNKQPQDKIVIGAFHLTC